jgi:hypothetical protein
MKKGFLIISLFFCLAAEAQDAPAGAKTSIIILPSNSQPRTKFGAARLAAALGQAGYRVWTHEEKAPPRGGRSIFISEGGTGPTTSSARAGKEGFTITSTPAGNIRITGGDASGALYGCLELADRIRASGHWPTRIDVKDQPEMALRGACIGLQKPTLLPGRGPYEYPYTPENFPWFYDKVLWVKYLDSMVDNRLNTLYLWNGHPFASLVRLPEYPYAVEVDDETFKKNEAAYRFLTEEAGKRGIWVIQLFYNIIVSKPFAEKNHLKTQDRNRHILPLIADYTRKSIAAFVEKYPNVGLMITLGEAMEGVGQDDIDWFTQTIIPGIKDGLKALGRTDEPPVVLRAHDTDGPAVMKAALPLYKNLYVEAKYNGEALTTYTPHGPWADLHRQLSHISKGLIENIHIMANLEPFRYGSADFIQKCVQAMHSVYGASGLHLYPQASYWDWPYAADDTDPRLLEMDRDWIWYKEWSRYAWNCHRDRTEEINYWSRQLADKYGCPQQQGKDILDAYEQAGEIAPKLLRRFGITDGNRQTLTLGMLMTQLIDPERYGLFTLLYESEGPPGEMLGQYAEKEWRHQPHEGETPVDVIRDVQEEGRLAVAAIEKAAAAVTANREEFARLRNDMYCYKALADCYAAKAEAALAILRYKYSNDLADLQNALPLLQNSLSSFGELTRLAGPAYRYANSMQTQQRKIPVRGANGKFITWGELLPLYKNEVERFRTHLDSLRNNPTSTGAPSAPTGTPSAPQTFIAATVGGPIDGYYTLDSGARVFTDTALTIRAVAGPLKRLPAIRQSFKQQKTKGTQLTFTSSEPVDLLIGFFDQKGAGYLPPPQLETDASANDFGQADPKISHALVVNGMPSVNVHAWSFPPGTHTFELGKGLCLVLGFVKPLGKTKGYDAALNEPGKKDLDWLFE